MGTRVWIGIGRSKGWSDVVKGVLQRSLLLELNRDEGEWGDLVGEGLSF
jgi:hypothetical protein